MPIVTEEDDAQPAPQPTLVIADKPYVGPVVDVRKEGYDSLATFYSGSKLPCDYYQARQGIDTAAASYQPGIPLPYGQRRLVKGFEIILNGALAHVQNTGDSMGFSTTGEAVCYGVVVPQPGDVFVAQIGNGRNALFQCSNSKRLSPFDESGYSFDIKAVKWVDAAVERDLNLGVVETVFFDRENFRNGIKSLLTDNDVDVMKRLSSAYRRLTASYLRDFYDDQFHTFMVPGQILPTYDPNVTRFMRRMISVVETPRIAHVVELGVSDDPYSRQLSLLDVILTNDEALLHSAAHRWDLAPIANFRSFSPMMHGVYFTGVKYVLSPHDPKYQIATEKTLPYTGFEMVKANVLFQDIDYILPALDLNEVEQGPAVGNYIKRVLVDNHYIFSKEFYDDEGERSLLEQMVMARLRNRAIDLKLLADLAEYASKFNNLERYYYIPIILHLIKRAPGVL